MTAVQTVMMIVIVIARNNIMNKLTYSLILFALLITSVFLPAKLSAQQSSLTLGIFPNQATLNLNEEKIIKITLSSPGKISGFDLKLNSQAPVKITAFVNEIETNSNFNPFDLRQVRKNVNGSNSEISYIFNSPQSSLPETINLYAKVIASAAGEGKISIDYQNSQILDGSGQLLQILPYSVTISSKNGQSSPTFIDPLTLPKPQYPPDTAFANLTLNLFGALNTSEKVKAIAVAVGQVGNEKYETAPQEFELTPQGKGIFKGRVAFPNFRDGNKFSLMIKTDKFLLKRICSLEAEKEIGAYQCKEPSLEIKSGENSFDFSGIALLPGDIGLADGYINGYDLALIRNNLNNNSAAPTADINLDGQVDKKDLDIVSYILLTTSGKADQ